MPLDDFGVFSLALFVYLFVIGVLRAFPMEPLADGGSTVDAATWRRGRVRPWERSCSLPV